MTREDIEKAVEAWPLRDVRELAVGFAVQQVNAAFEEAASHGDRWEGTDCKQHDTEPCCHVRSYLEYARKIRALKVKP